MLKPRILMSYAYLSQAKLNALAPYRSRFKMLIDCGAYTAYTRGKIINLSEYLGFLDKLLQMGFEVEGYLALDVVNDEKQTYENLHTMLNAGYSPMPIFTRGASMEQLEEFFELTDYIAIGGVFNGGASEHSYMKALMTDHVKDRKVHWLGYGPRDMLFYFKPFSFDTSSFSAGVRFGTITMFQNGHRIILQKKNLSSWISNPRIRSIFNRYRVDIDRFRKDETWHNDGTYSEKTGILGHLCILSYCDYYYRMEKRGITRAYMAVTDESQALRCIECYEKIIKISQ